LFLVDVLSGSRPVDKEKEEKRGNKEKNCVLKKVKITAAPGRGGSVAPWKQKQACSGNCKKNNNNTGCGLCGLWVLAYHSMMPDVLLRVAVGED